MDEKDEKDENKKNDKNLDQGGGEEDLGGAEASSLGENGASDGSKKKKKKKKAAKWEMAFLVFLPSWNKFLIKNPPLKMSLIQSIRLGADFRCAKCKQ